MWREVSLVAVSAGRRRPGRWDLPPKRYKIQIDGLWLYDVLARLHWERHHYYVLARDADHAKKIVKDTYPSRKKYMLNARKLAISTEG